MCSLGHLPRLAIAVPRRVHAPDGLPQPCALTMKQFRSLVLCALTVLTQAEPAHAQHALRRFRALTGLNVRPPSSFVLCRGASLNQFTCEPTTSGWEPVSSVSEYTLPENVSDTSSTRTIGAAVSAAYLGAGFGDIGGRRQIAMACLNDTAIRALDRFRPAPTMIRSNVLQAVETEAVRDGVARFNTVLNATNLSRARKVDARGSFEAALRDSLRSQTSQSTALRWVVVSLNATESDLRGLPGLEGCRTFVEENDGSIVTGIAGLVLMKNQGVQTYATSSMFARSASAALNVSLDAMSPQVGEAVANASTTWSARTSRRIATQIDYELSQPVFYPFWVQFTVLD